ncbi:MAG: AAA family ATPase [Saprospiraceae bacterium]|nr:AAA family ATPase [Pyrinomonadaceae bacterium]
MKEDLETDTDVDSLIKELGFGGDFDPDKKSRKAREKHSPKSLSSDTMLETRPAGDWISRKISKPPCKLFGDLWSEGEIAILFSATGIGKSILAVQIAESIAKGCAIEPLECTAKPQKVLYLDFELTKAQFAARYSSDEKPARHLFPKNLIRAEICEFDSVPDTFKNNATAFLQHSVIAAINETEAKIIIIDNLTFLTGAGWTPLSLMKNLKLLAKNKSLSILVLAHSSEGRDCKPLTVNDLQGAKVLANYADSVFTLGRSIHAPNYRYIKHLKSRTSEPTHGAANVIVYRIIKTPASPDLQIPATFPGFDHLGFSEESAHFPDYFLKLQAAQDRDRKLQLRSARKSNSLTEHILTGQYARYLNP